MACTQQFNFFGESEPQGLEEVLTTGSDAVDKQIRIMDVNNPTFPLAVLRGMFNSGNLILNSPRSVDDPVNVSYKDMVAGATGFGVHTYDTGSNMLCGGAFLFPYDELDCSSSAYVGLTIATREWVLANTTGGGTPTLQQVTTAGASTNDDVTFNGINHFANDLFVEGAIFTLNQGGLLKIDKGDGNFYGINSDATITAANQITLVDDGTGDRAILNKGTFINTGSIKTFSLPDEDTGILATQSFVNSNIPTLAQVTAIGPTTPTAISFIKIDNTEVGYMGYDADTDGGVVSISKVGGTEAIVRPDKIHFVTPGKDIFDLAYPLDEAPAAGDGDMERTIMTREYAASRYLLGAGNGVSGYIPVWTDGSEQGYTDMQYDGLNYSIGAAIDSAYKLSVNGNFKVAAGITGVSALISGIITTGQINQGSSHTLGGNNASVFGSTNTSTGARSFVTGRLNVGSGPEVFVAGLQNSATGIRAVCTGQMNSSTNTISHCFGWNCISSGVAAIALGMGSFARSYGETTVGSYNADYTPVDPANWNIADVAFQVGIGNTTTRANGMTTWKNGHTQFGYSTTPADNGSVIQSTGDIEVTDSAAGIILKDDVDGTRYRITISGGNLTITAV